MKLELRKRKNPSLRKLTKTDSEGTSLTEDPLYVLLEEAEGNVSLEGSTITPEVVDKINWKDETNIEFSVLKDDVLPSPKNGAVLIAAKPNGEIWAIPSNKGSYPLGTTDMTQFLKKTGTQYAQNMDLSYFNLNNKLNLFSTKTCLGAIPERNVQSNTIEDGTYIEFNSDGIKYYVNETIVHEITPDKLYFTHHNGKIAIDHAGKIDLISTNSTIQSIANKVLLQGITKVSLDAGTDMILESGDRFSLESPNTKIQETKDKLKFNCFTELSEASYGNQNYRLQFYSDYVRLRDVKNKRDIIQINPDGSLYVNKTIRVVDESIVNQYIEKYFNNHFESYFINYFNNYFESHFINCFNNHFEKYYLNYYNKYFHNILVFSGAETQVDINVLEDSIFQLFFSDTEASGRHILVFNGLDVKNSEVSMVINSITYRIRQDISTDEQYGDYVEVCKFDSNGNNLGNALIREIYRTSNQ